MAKLKGGSRVYGSLQVDGTFLDTSGDAGTSGQVLSSTGTGTNWVAAGGGGGGGGISNYAKYVGTGTLDVNSSTTYTERSWINTTAQFSSGTWSATSSAITVPNAGLYLVQVNWYLTSSVQRANIGLRFAINDTQQSEIAAHNYIRSASGHNQASVNMSTTFNLSASDQISIYSAQLAASGTVTLEGTSSTIAITQLA